MSANIKRFKKQPIFGNSTASHKPVESSSKTLDKTAISSYHHDDILAPPLVYSVEEVTGILKIGRSMVYRLINYGEIPTVRIGRRTLIRANDLSSFVAGLPVDNSREGF